MRQLLCLPVLLLALASTTGTAQVYKVTDPDKGVVFTDRPEAAPGSTVEEIQIREPNQAPPPPQATVPPRTTGSTGSKGAAEAPAVSITITSPANESTIAMGPGNFAVSAKAEPPLQGGEEVVLLVDGQPLGAAQTTLSWFIEGALRGPHDLVVQRLSRSGQTVAISEPVRVYVLRPSIIGR